MKLSRLGQTARVFKAISPEGQSRASNARLPLCSVYLLKRCAFVRVGAGGDFFRQAAPRNQVCFPPTIPPSVVPAGQAGGAVPLSHLLLGSGWSCLAVGSPGPGMGGRKIPGECGMCRDWVESRRGTRHKSDQETEGWGISASGDTTPLWRGSAAFPRFLVRLCLGVGFPPPSRPESNTPTPAPGSPSKPGSPQQQPSVSLLSPRCHPPSL